MHRSITLSEIVSSTFSNNGDNVENIEIKKYKLRAKIGIGLSEFLVCSLYQCYGILLTEFVESAEYPLEKAAWTTLIYLAAWHITAPSTQFSMKYFECKPHYYHKIIISVATTFLAVGIVIPPHYVCYGIFGGVFSNIIYTHIKYLSRKKFKSTEKSFEANIQAARAISLLIMPHIILLLITNFSLNRVTMMYAAIIFNIIPSMLIIRFPQEKSTEYEFSGTNRYHTLPAFSQQMKEMKVFSNSGNTSDMNYSHISNHVYESVEDDKSDDEDTKKDDENDDLLFYEKPMDPFEYPSEEVPPLPPTPLTSNTVQMYFSQAGVSILPEIPEEEELEETNINVIDKKRLSRISTALEELNSKETNSIKELIIPKDIIIKPEPIQEIEYIHNYNQKKMFIQDIKFKNRNRCCLCSPYTLFVWRRRIRTWKDFLIDYFFIPIFGSLSDLHFYPILLSKISIAVSSILFISLTPYATLEKNDKYSKEDLAFLLSYIAFSWCLSLIAVPLIMRFSAVKLRFTFIVGLVLNSCSMLLLTKQKMSNDFIIWSCLLFGFGYGLTKYTEQLVYKSFAGKQNYRRFEGTLHVFTGFFVILIYYLVYIHKIALVSWYPITTAFCYCGNVILWTIVPFIKEILIFLLKYYRNKEDDVSIF